MSDIKHLLGIDELSKSDIETYLDKAEHYADALDKGNWDKDLLKDKIIMNLFFENSTRTLTSFDIASKRLGAEVVNWSPKDSSLAKGESFTDTIDTLNAMRPDAVVIRHSEFGAPKFVAARMDCPVINGGDSWREHPTQALLDALTIKQHFGKIAGLTIAIIGDIAHSRVASSNLRLLEKMGAKLRVIAPEILIPQKMPVENVEVFHSLKDGLKGTDVVMTLRLQKERMDAALIASDAAYFKEYGLNNKVLDEHAPNAMVMDPGPLIRGVHIADDIADNPERSLILKQVANGIPTRMAVLDLLLANR